MCIHNSGVTILPTHTYQWRPMQLMCDGLNYNQCKWHMHYWKVVLGTLTIRLSAVLHANLVKPIDFLAFINNTKHLITTVGREKRVVLVSWFLYSMEDLLRIFVVSEYYDICSHDMWRNVTQCDNSIFLRPQRFVNFPTPLSDMNTYICILIHPCRSLSETWNLIFEIDRSMTLVFWIGPIS